QQRLHLREHTVVLPRARLVEPEHRTIHRSVRRLEPDRTVDVAARDERPEPVANLDLVGVQRRRYTKAQAERVVVDALDLDVETARGGLTLRRAVPGHAPYHRPSGIPE